MGKLVWQVWHLPQMPTSAVVLVVWHGVAVVWHLPKVVWQQHPPPSPASLPQRLHSWALALMPLMTVMIRHGRAEPLSCCSARNAMTQDSFSETMSLSDRHDSDLSRVTARLFRAHVEGMAKPGSDVCPVSPVPSAPAQLAHRATYGGVCTSPQIVVHPVWGFTHPAGRLRSRSAAAGHQLHR